MGVHDNKPLNNFTQIKNLINKIVLFMIVKLKYLIHEVKNVFDIINSNSFNLDFLKALKKCLYITQVFNFKFLIWFL